MSHHDNDAEGGDVAEEELDEFFLAFACVNICDFKFVDWANFLSQFPNGQTYGRSPVWIRMCVRKLKSKEKRFPQLSKGH